MNSQSLAKVLWCAAAGPRIEWYFNNMRCRHAAPRSILSLLGAGTGQSESLHHEINNWFRNQPELYSQTLQLQLEVNCLGKLISHNAAAYSPGLRQLDQQTILVASAARMEIPDAVWSAWVGELAPEDPGRQVKATLPLRAERLRTAALLKQKRVPRRIISKKPAASCTVRKVKSKTKRTVFTKRRTR